MQALKSLRFRGAYSSFRNGAGLILQNFHKVEGLLTVFRTDFNLNPDEGINLWRQKRGRKRF